MTRKTPPLLRLLPSRLKLSLLILLLCPSHYVLAQRDDFPEICNSEPDPSLQPMAAKEAAASMKVPNGFGVQLFSSEPDVQNPIAMTWDARGRMWVAENYTYAERAQKFDLNLRDRVVVLEDEDGDGEADKRTVFTDQVQMLTSIEVGRGGVWLMCPPQLLFVPDRDNDLQADGPVEIVLDGFEVAKANYHNFANGLRWGPDGWLYGRCGGSCPGRVGIPGTPDQQRVAIEGGIWRFHPKTKQFEALTHGTTNPWGHDWNEWGEGFFINTVNGHLWHLIPGAHLHRPFTLDPNPHVYELIDMHADHWHFDTGSGWTASRDGAANSFGGGHAHTGMMIYQGNDWPDEYRGNLFTWNFHGHRSNQELLEREGSGYVAKHGDDLFFAEDPFFRGMELSTGPDGAVYVLDWSDTGECHEHSGVHRSSGRVFRISFKDGELNDSPPIDLTAQSSLQLAELMRHANEWYARQARLLLVERVQSKGEDDLGQEFKTCFKLLEKMVEEGGGVESYRSLVTLHAVGALDTVFLKRQLSHSNEHLRAWAIRLLTDTWPLDDVHGPLNLSDDQKSRVVEESENLMRDFCNLATTDNSSLVRLALASTLQRLPVSDRPTLAKCLVARADDANDHNLPLLVWYGLLPVAESSPTRLAEVALSSRWPKTQRLAVRRLAEEIDSNGPAIEKVVAFIATTSDAQIRQNLLLGLSDGLKGWSRAPQPKNWKGAVKVVSKKSDSATLAIIRELSVLFGDGRAMEEVRLIVLDQDEEIGVRRSALMTLISRFDEEVKEICLSLLSDQRLNSIAAKGLTKSSDATVAKELVSKYKRFRAPNRAGVIEILASRPAFADALLIGIEKGAIPVDDLTPFDVRQIRSLNDESLNERIGSLWGEVRETPEAKQLYIEKLKGQLTESNRSHSDLSHGRELFQKSCAKCHKLFGQGEAIGPDLTGANRNNLDYILENVIDPSAVVSKDFRMSIIEMIDGRVLNGLVLTKNAKTLTLQTQTDQLTIKLADVEEIRVTSSSPMPDGLLDNLSEDQIQNLLSYLMHPTQVSLPQ